MVMTEAKKAGSSYAAASLNKACEPCRALKVRCLPAIQGPSPACQRCLKFDRICVYASPHRKKQRKRTDARVAELEKEIVAMRALLEQSQPSDKASSRPSTDAAVSSSAQRPNISTGRDPQMTPDSLSISASQTGDIVERGTITAKEAQRLLDTYRAEFVPHFPLVLIPEHQTAEQLRREQPLLFLAVMATASSKAHPGLYSALSTEVIQDYISRVMIKGQKSLEIVKAIMLTCAWYYPADRWSSLKFYECTHLGSTVAVDIGLSERDTVSIPRDETDARMGVPALMMERKRTLLACYAQCASISLNMRRPNMFHFTTYMADIGREFETAQGASPTDKSLSAFIRIVNIGEEISVAFSLSDGGREGLISDQQLQQALITYQKKLILWKDVYRQQSNTIDMQIMYHYVRLVLHETPLHNYYLPSLFRAPFFLQAPLNTGIKVSDTACHCLSQSVAAAHAMLDAFVAQPVDQIRTLPCHIFPRIIFALIVLIAIKMLPLPSEDEDAVAATGIYHASTEVDIYMNAVVDKMLEAAGTMEYRVPTIFAISIVNVRKWFLWAEDRHSRGLSPDGGLTFGLFTSTEDHPALHADLSPDSNSSFAGSPPNDAGQSGSRTQSLSNESPLINSADGGVAAASTTGYGGPRAFPTPEAMGLPSTAIAPDLMHGKMEGSESQWMDALQQDYSSILDPTLFESGAEYGDLANAVQEFMPMEYLNSSGPAPDSIQAFAQAEFGGDMGLYTNLPGPMVRPPGKGNGFGM
ncbi:hypothetical protein KVT40_006745 [Elsinoe batatas]|uniref:Zn(2)-C6 fungal-type domain-containing protein n=1 Tax=Elsinoe batatas TaxID=2601811 RepID=A0A8K0KW27_9PEZI|nr:hypothetical protein KVT40_006745 [Elsinoe batatas]